MKTDCKSYEDLDEWYNRYMFDKIALLDKYKSYFEKSKKHKVKFLFNALEHLVLNPELYQNGDTHWILDGFYEELKSKVKKADEKFSIAVFIHELNLRGAPKSTAFESFAEWYGIAETTPREAYYDFQKLYESDSENLELNFWFNVGQVIELIEKAPRKFPNSHPKVLKAFLRLLEDILQASERIGKLHEAREFFNKHGY